LVTTLGLGLAVVGCGGDDASQPASGVNRSKYMDQLNASEIQQLCSWSAGIMSPGEHTCPGGLTAKVDTESECADSIRATPVHCSVSAAEDCIISTKGDPCRMLSTAACGQLIKCLFEDES
jgi:hypothetical protein